MESARLCMLSKSSLRHTGGPDKHWRAIHMNRPKAGAVKTKHIGRWSIRLPKQNEKKKVVVSPFDDIKCPH